MSKGLWRERPLESYSKEELIEIVLSMGRMQDDLRDQAAKDRDMLLGRADRGRPNWKAAFYLFGGIAFGLVVVGLLLRLSIHSS